MTVVASKSVIVTAGDTPNPLIQFTTGEGAPGRLKVMDDFLATTAAQMASTTSSLDMCRIPTNAKVKAVFMYLGGVDSNGTGAAVFDINLRFSTSATDGTPPALAGLIPTSALTGLTTTVAAYSSPNILFGQITASNSGAVNANANVTYQTGGAFTPAMRDIPLWSIFGFTNSQSVAQDPGGFFQFYLRVSTAANTGAAATVGIMTEYVL